MFASTLLCCFVVVGPLVHGMGLFLFRRRSIDRCPLLQGDYLLDCQTESSASMLSSSPWPTAASMLMLCIMAIAAAITTSSSNGDARRRLYAILVWYSWDVCAQSTVLGWVFFQAAGVFVIPSLFFGEVAQRKVHALFSRIVVFLAPKKSEPGIFSLY